MTPAALYNRVSERTGYEVGILNGFYYAHMPELQNDVLPHEDPNQRVQIRYYKDFDFDGRRFWRLASVWYSRERGGPWEPFMIIQNAGREGDDWRKRFITSVGMYAEAVHYLKSVCIVKDVLNDMDIVNPYDDVPKLTEFYGHELNEEFKRSRF